MVRDTPPEMDYEAFKRAGATSGRATKEQTLLAGLQPGQPVFMGRWAKKQTAQTARSHLKKTRRDKMPSMPELEFALREVRGSEPWELWVSLPPAQAPERTGTTPPPHPEAGTRGGDGSRAALRRDPDPEPPAKAGEFCPSDGCRGILHDPEGDGQLVCSKCREAVPA